MAIKSDTDLITKFKIKDIDNDQRSNEEVIREIYFPHKQVQRLASKHARACTRMHADAKTEVVISVSNQVLFLDVLEFTI